jgi:hypothetical protein
LQLIVETMTPVERNLQYLLKVSKRQNYFKWIPSLCVLKANQACDGVVDIIYMSDGFLQLVQIHGAILLVWNCSRMYPTKCWYPPLLIMMNMTFWPNYNLTPSDLVHTS